MIVETRSTRVTVRDCVRAAALATGIDPRELLSGSRRDPLVKARALAAAVARRFGWSYPRIGAALARDHSSVIHLVRRIEADAALDTAALIVRTMGLAREIARGGGSGAPAAPGLAGEIRLPPPAPQRQPPAPVRMPPPVSIDPRDVDRVLSLRRKGWSDIGIARHTGLALAVVRPLIGIGEGRA